ncbi:DUF4124 domain-containing protein [Ramlibacter sp.]|uniref:DUF4124 domain-containing protein n=1 Tax=Ramlibacter sp. TaxID=1917967 RepID=UPI002D4D39D0|nr:DUF4124 domain-containing protein [Ramlibacter sp.]HYD76501.1 DUF4124 domain-containing protein [Ramlibacter sp.]
MNPLRLVFVGGLLFSSATCGAQAVYKCVSKGSVVYSHEPCLGATVVDTTPTQGLDKWTGKTRKGADVARTEHNKAMADALRPLFNETPEQRERRLRRAKLAPADRLECGKLDADIEAGASKPGFAQGAAATPTEQRLFEQRKKYRELGC